MMNKVEKLIFLILLLQLNATFAVLTNGRLPDPDLSIKSHSFHRNGYSDSPYNLHDGINPIVQNQQQSQLQVSPQEYAGFSYQSLTGPIIQQQGSSNFGFSPLQQNTAQYNTGESIMQNENNGNAAYNVPQIAGESSHAFTAAAAGFNGYDQQAGSIQNFNAPAPVDRFYTHGQLSNQNYESQQPINAAYTLPPIGSAGSLFFKPIDNPVNMHSHSAPYAPIATFQPTPPPPNTNIFQVKNIIRPATTPNYAKGEKGLGYYTYAVSKPLALEAEDPQAATYASTVGKRSNFNSEMLYHQEPNQENPAGYFTTVKSQGSFGAQESFSGSHQSFNGASQAHFAYPQKPVSEVVYGRPYDVGNIHGRR